MFPWEGYEERIVRAISFQDFKPACVLLVHQRYRQTDGQTDDMQSQYRALHYSASRVNDHHSHMTGLILTGAWWNVFRFTLPVTLIQSFLKIHVTFNLSGIRP